MSSELRSSRYNLVVMAWDEEEIRRLITEIQAGVDVEKHFERLFRLFYRSVHSFFLRKHFPPGEAHTSRIIWPGAGFIRLGARSVLGSWI